MSNEKTNFALTGRLIWKGEPKQVSEKFTVQEFVIEVEGGQWSSFPKFQLANERCALIDNYTTGALLKVHFNVQGRKWTKEGQDNYFVTLAAWKIVGLDAAQEPSAVPAPAVVPANDTAQEIFGNDDDLPF